MLESSTSKDTREEFPKPHAPYRIRIKEFFLQPKNQNLIMASYSHSPVQDWYFRKIPNTEDQYMIVNVATEEVICAPWLHQGEWANIKTRHHNSKYNYGFRFKASQYQNGYHILSRVDGHQRIWDARNGEAYDSNSILNWHTPHHKWNQTFRIQEINPQLQLQMSNFIRAQRLCAVCLFYEADMINVGCMHAATCERCSWKVGNRCVICRHEGNLRKIRFC